MSIVCGLITFIAFLVDMVWMNCVYHIVAINTEKVEDNSKLSSTICIIVLFVNCAIIHFANYSEIMLFATLITLILCIIKRLSFTKIIKELNTTDIEDEDDYVPENIFDELDEYGEDECEIFKKYNGEEAEAILEVSEENINEDDIIDVIDEKTDI